MNLTPSDSRICVASGIASGIGAIFRAPFGGALLGVELLYTDDVEIEALVPSLVATVVGYGIFCAITGNYSPVFGSHANLPATHLVSLLLFVVVGLAAGVAGKLYTNCFYGLTDRFNRWNVPRAAKPAAAGLVVGAIGLAIPGVLGTGYGELQAQLILHQLLTTPWLIVLLLPLAKILATSLSIGSGGSGGIFGPGLVIGGATGALLWRVGHLFGVGPDEQVAFVIVAVAATFASIAHAPIAVLVMVVEMTGSLSLLPAAIVAVAVAMLVVGDAAAIRWRTGSTSVSPGPRSPSRTSWPLPASF
jgi:CIC family chloride channel protein